MKILNSLIKKEYYQIIRDPSSIIIAFVLPLMLIFIFAYGINLDTNSSKVGVLNQDYDAREFVSSIQGTRYLEVYHYNDRRLMEDDLVSKRLNAMMIIPNDFSKKFKQPGGVAEVQVITDGVETNDAVFVNGHIAGAIGVWSKIYAQQSGMSVAPAIDIKSSAWFNKDLNGLNIMLSGSIASIMNLIGVLLTALVVAREWERGTMESMLTTRATKMDIILGKYIPYYLLTMVSALICFVVCVFGFKVPFRGSFLVFLVSGSFFVLNAVGLGLLISTITKNQFLSCIMAATLGLLPSMLLGGSVFDINSMPLVLQLLTYIVPARYFTPCIQNLFMAETMWSIIIPQTFFLAVGATIFFILVYKNSGKKLE